LVPLPDEEPAEAKWSSAYTFPQTPCGYDGTGEHSVYGCDGHRHGFPWCLSATCLSAAPYGAPYEFFHYERPFGSLLRSCLGTQVAHGTAARMVLYNYDFYAVGSNHAARLTSRGRDQLEKIARLMIVHPFPVLIERSRNNRALDEARRQHVILELGETLNEDAANRVFIANPPAVGLDGVEAIDVYNNQLIQTQTGGAVPIRGVESNMDFQ
jgi:hypothetical protein